MSNKRRRKRKKFNVPKDNAAPGTSPIREKIHEIIFEADTAMGFLFDVILLVAIFLSVVLICLDTVDGLMPKDSKLFYNLEWFFTILFTIEYALRLYCVRRPWRYALSFYGIIDLLSILPSYILLFYSVAPSFAIIRIMRLLRVFRVFKLIHLMGEAEELANAIINARGKVLVFFGFIVMTVCIAGTLMFEIENAGVPGRSTEANVSDSVNANTVIPLDNNASNLSAQNLPQGPQEPKATFRNIPEAIYWAIVTMTTVGYGDIVPQTVLGKIVASVLILLGYSMIIVPTGFVSAEFVAAQNRPSSIHCQSCVREGHEADAIFCKFCGEEL